MVCTMAAEKHEDTNVLIDAPDVIFEIYQKSKFLEEITHLFIK